MNNINRVATLLLGNYTTILFSFYCWDILLKEKNINNKNIIITDIIITLINIFFYNQLKILLVCISLVIINRIVICKDIKKSIILVSTSQVILALSEFLVILIFSIMLGKSWEIYMMKNYMFIVLSFCITILSLIIIATTIPKKVFELFVNSNYKKNKQPIIYSIMTIIILIITSIEIYKNVSISIIIGTNLIMMTIFIFIIVRSTIIDDKFDSINSKYQTSINSLKEYETMIDKFRVNNHENKNELMTIRNMIKNKDKNTIEYIDKLVDNKIKDNEKIIYQTSKIPEGGLRATIYSKLCVMDKYKIKYKLDISKDVRTVDLINLDDELVLNICKILGVFMDNAIEAVKSLRKKEVNIELYVIDNKMFIDITNNFKGNIDLSKIGHEKHTTKGEEHGYGLLLVNKIINENSKYLENEKSINGNYFTQSLIVKL